MDALRSIGVDVGGTFTDLVLVGPDGMHVHKVPSTPADPSRSVVDLLAMADPDAKLAVVHGTTVATNALLQARGARTAFVATEGFADLLALGRGQRQDLFSLEPGERPCLVPPDLRFEVHERLSSDGSVLVPLGRGSVARVARAVRSAGAEAVAVCLLFSYLDGTHERAVGRALGGIGAPGPYVSLSVEVLPEFREYERASTVAVNAYVGPLVSAYLGRLQEEVRPRRLRIMASHGGALLADQAARLPVTTVLSGPAAGVIGAIHVAARCGRHRLITLDMGGTSTDVSLCQEGVPFTAAVTVAGLPVHRPAVDVHTVGAGGGSYARVDEGGALRVGPESAGAIPGPASCRRGGLRPTVTDANVLLGRLPAEWPLAGGLRLDEQAARDALGRLGAGLGLDPEDAALGVLAVANATMERALRRVSVERGHAPRDFTLVAFGGAGPLHACALAEALGMGEVLVPAAPGALSALGLAVSPPVASVSRSVVRAAGSGPPDAERVFDELQAEATRSMDATGPVGFERSADARYQGQSWELNVPWPGRSEALADAFHRLHAARYGYDRPGVPVELVTLRVRAVGRPSGGLPPSPPFQPGSALKRPVVLEGGRRVQVPVWPRWSLTSGTSVSGPGVIVQQDATTFLASGWTASVGDWGDLTLRRQGIDRRP